MSPHAVAPESPVRQISVELEEFGVTKNAFLPEFTPLEILPDPYYEPWESIMDNLPELVATGRIHSTVSWLPVLSTARLLSEPEWRRAYSILAYMTHAYVWGGDKPEEILPPQIAVPFLRVSEHLELPPVLSYAACNLWNFTTTSDDFSDLEHLRTLFSLTGTESEAWFLLVSVAIEAQAAGVIDTMMEALHAVKTRDLDVIASALDELKLCIQGVGKLLERMYERCDPHTFYHRIRPLMAGSKNMEDAGLPRGVFYDEGDGKGEWRHLRGGSNGQSSLIQFFDIVLGVEHKPNGNSKPSAADSNKSFLTEVRDYMPGPHRRFLTHVSRMGSIRELAMLEATTEAQLRLRSAYTEATDALTELRNKHIQIVTRYIILPSKQQPKAGTAAASKKKDLASMAMATGSDGQVKELTGTGGTALVPFLKQVRDETVDAGKLEK